MKDKSNQKAPPPTQTDMKTFQFDSINEGTLVFSLALDINYSMFRDSIFNHIIN